MGMICVGGCATSNPSTSASASTAVSSFTATDRAWIEINIAMDEQLVPMLNLVDGHTGSAAVRDLGKKADASTKSELSDLRRLHDQAGLPAENPHKGMEMPGMVSSNQITHMRRFARGGFRQLLQKVPARSPGPNGTVGARREVVRQRTADREPGFAIPAGTRASLRAGSLAAPGGVPRLRDQAGRRAVTIRGAATLSAGAP